MDKKPSLENAYAMTTPQHSRELYSIWADRYDQDFAGKHDYIMPQLIARAFVDYDGKGRILDIGAGTGLVGAQLQALGQTHIDGTDISPEMLKIAQQKGCYSDIFVADITAKLDAADAVYDGLISAGTFTLGHVGPQALDELLRIAKPNAHFALAINRAHYDGAGFAAKFDKLGPHITGLSLREACIYGENAQGDHSSDTGYIALFQKA